MNIARALINLSGNSFVGLSTRTIVGLSGGKGNPMQGKIEKLTTGSQVMVFQNKKINGYESMVRRRLEKEGKDPSTFVLGERAWGRRLPNLPIVEHTPANEINPKHYLEVIFLKPGRVEYRYEGEFIGKDEIIGLKPTPENDEGQGGLNNKVVIRTYDVASITTLKIDRMEFNGPFYYQELELVE